MAVADESLSLSTHKVNKPQPRVVMGAQEVQIYKLNKAPLACVPAIIQSDAVL